MVRNAPAVVCGLLLSAAASCSPAWAQLSAGAEISSEYVWRGLLAGDRAVVMPWLAGEWEAGAATYSVGLSVAVEPFAYGAAGSGGLSGRRAPGVVDAELWLDASRTFGRWETTAGVQAFVPSDAAGLQPGEFTTELYLVAVRGGRTAPAVRIFGDVHRLRGIYGEVGVRHEAARTGVPAVELMVGMAGHTADAAYYAGTGVTHMAVSLEWAWTLGAVLIAPSLHAQLGVDEATRTGSWPGRRGRSWLGVALSRAGSVP
jgi:hypothetical protein